MILFLIWYNLFTKIYTHTDIETWFFTLLDSLDKKEVMSILSRIIHIRDTHHWLPKPPNAKDLHRSETAMFEFRIPISDNQLVRINYFVDNKTDSIVILNAYIKPDGIKSSNSYNKANKREIDSEVEWLIQEAIRLKGTYITNPEYYELLD